MKKYKVCSGCGQRKKVSEFYKHCASKDGLQNKCKVCDREGRAKRRRVQLKDFYDYKRTLSCDHCGYNEDHRAIEFHHVDPSTKEGAISDLVAKYGFSHRKVQMELDKCIPLCANCHRIVHSYMDFEEHDPGEDHIVRWVVTFAGREYSAGSKGGCKKLLKSLLAPGRIWTRSDWAWDDDWETIEVSSTGDKWNRAEVVVIGGTRDEMARYCYR